MDNKLEALTRVLARVLSCDAGALIENFRPARMEELDELVAFRSRNLEEALAWDDREYFLWRYRFGEQNAEEFPVNRVWILKINQQLLGMVGVVETPISTGGQLLKGAHPLDLLVEKKLDGFGLGAWMNYVIASRYDPVLIIGANKNSQSIVRRIFHPMPNRELWKYFLDARFIFEKFHFPRPVINILALISEPVLSLGRALKRKKLAGVNLEFRELENFSGSLEQDLESAGASWPAQMFFRKRSAQFLNERFLACPTCEFRACGLFKDTTMVAYVIYRLMEDQMGKKRAEVVDFFWRNPASKEGKTECLSLLLEFARFAKTQGVRLIQLTSYGVYPRTILKTAGFVARPDENLLISIGCQMPELQGQIYNSDNWFLTDADAHGAGV